MDKKTDLTPRQKEILDLYKHFDHFDRAVAEHLNISIGSVRKNLYFAAKKGHYIAPDHLCEQAPAGFGLTKSTLQINKNGQVVQRWDRVSPVEQAIELFIQSLIERVPVAPVNNYKPLDGDIQDGIAFVWPCVDLHIGLAAWKPETLDSNFNLKISKKLEDAANTEMYKKVGNVEHIHLAFLGDTTHNDNRLNKTERSGNILDVDSRYPKIIDTCQQIICNKIDMALCHAKTVSVDILPGNHDPNTAVCILRIIAAYYHNEPRIIIKTSPAQFKFFKWGVSIMMGCHGDEAPPSRLSAFLMDYVIQNEIKAKELYVYRGHVHHRKSGIVPGIDETDGGVLVETFPTLTAKDGWHASKAYSSRRATIGKLFHKDHGLIDDCKINAKFLSSKYEIY